MVDKLIVAIICLMFTCQALASDPTKPQIFVNKTKTVSNTNTKPKVQQPLTAIFTKNRQRSAMIEGKLYRSGEYYKGSKIIKIEQDKVLLVSSEGSLQLTLIPTIKSASNIKSN